MNEPDPRLRKLIEERDAEKKRRVIAERTVAQEKGRSAKLRALVAQLKAKAEQPEQRAAC